MHVCILGFCLIFFLSSYNKKETLSQTGIDYKWNFENWKKEIKLRRLQEANYCASKLAYTKPIYFVCVFIFYQDNFLGFLCKFSLMVYLLFAWFFCWIICFCADKGGFDRSFVSIFHLYDCPQTNLLVVGASEHATWCQVYSLV